MKYISFAFLLFFIWAVNPFVATADSLLQKSAYIDFEPDQVRLVLRLQDNSVLSSGIGFHVSKVSGSKANYLLNAVALVPKTAQAETILLSGVDPESRQSKVACLFVEEGEVVEQAADVVADIKASILGLRTTYTDSLKSFETLELEVRELQRKAASLARLNRLVEAESTAISLKRKLEGLQSDQLNLSKLLEVVKTEKSSMRSSVSEAALAKDLRILSERAVSSVRPRAALSDKQRQEAYEIIQKAQGLDIVSLREKVNKLNLQKMTGSGNGGAANAEMEDSQKLAEEYDRKNNLD